MGVCVSCGTDVADEEVKDEKCTDCSSSDDKEEGEDSGDEE